MKTALIAIGTLLCAIVLVWVLAMNDLAMGAFFAPKQEQVRRNTFETSKAYTDGMIQELRAMQFEYIKADPEHKVALASVIKHRAAGFPEQSMPSDLSSFIRSLP